MARRRGPSQRPETWRFNHSSPLANGLVFAHLGQCIGSTTYKDASPYNNDGTLVNYTGAGNLPQDRWGWSNYLKRPILSFSGASSDYVSSSTACKPLQGISYATVAAWMSKSAGAQIGAGAGTGRFLILWFTDGNAYFTAKGSPLSAAGASGTRHFCMSIAGNSLVGHIDGVQKVTSTNAGTTTLAATLGPQICGYDSTNGYSTGSVADLCFWTRVLSDSEKWQIADPSNFDLRIGATPLLLPVRRYWGAGFNLPSTFWYHDSSMSGGYSEMGL